MNGYDVVEIALNQRFFTVIIVIAAIGGISKPDHKALAILAFVLCYFSTQIPLISNAISISSLHRYVIQSLISVAMLLFYTTIPKNSAILFAAGCELALIANNVLFAVGHLHPWYHWAVVSAINWAAFISLCLNKWGKEANNVRFAEKCARTARSLAHVYGRNRDL